jgi:hypothetical protein
MGKASSAKKVARAARAGGNRRAGQRRALGFPLAIGLILVVGLLLVFFARERRNADAFPKANVDHIHASIDIYTCVTQASTESTTTTAPAASGSDASSTTTTAAPPDSTTTTVPTSTTQAGPNDVHGQYQPAPKDASQDVLGIHTHGDGLMHIHPFKDSVAGRKATLGVFLDQVRISMTDDTLELSSGTFKEGTTKCEGGKDGILQVAKWDSAANAAKGDKPNQIFKSGFDKIRLGANESFTIAFMPDGSTIPAKSDVETRIKNVTDVVGATTVPASGAPASGAPASGAPTSPTATSPASDQGSSTTATTAPAGTSSSGP